MVQWLGSCRDSHVRRCQAPAHLILENDVQSVDDTGNVTKDGQADVDAEVSTTATLQKDTDGRKDDGKEDFANVAGGERHVGGLKTATRISEFYFIAVWWCCEWVDGNMLEKQK